jgi:lipoprotein-releasing system permease protein
MKTSFFIAGRLSGNRANTFSRAIVMIAVASVAIGLIVMIVAMAVVTGFQVEITNKVVGFGSNVQIVKYDSNNSYEMEPLSLHQDYYPSLATEKGIRHIQMFGVKAGLIKVGEDIQGMVLKGIGQDYDWSFFQDKILTGRPVMLSDSGVSNDIMISKTLSSIFKINVQDEVRMFFLTSESMQPRGRKFQVCGIFETGMEELDNMFVIGDIAHIQKLNDWEDDEVSGFEVLIDDFNNLDAMTRYIDTVIPFDQSAVSIKQSYPAIFDWLNLQDVNALIIIILMLFVSGITMISTLLIVVFENVSTIGILKALGGNNKLIREVFILLVTRIVLLGVVIGDVLGIGLCLLQKHFSIIKLPQESYYMSEVPIMLQFWHILLLNLAIFATSLLAMWLTSAAIAKISPMKTIRSN